MNQEKLVKQSWKLKLPKLIKTNELLNSHEWPRENFSPQYPYNLKPTSDENKEKYQERDYQLFQ